MLSRATRIRGAHAAQPFSWNEPTADSSYAIPDAPAPAIEPTVPVASMEALQIAAPQVPQVSLAELEREAFASGYAEGERAGFDAGSHRAEAMLRRLAATLDELTTLRRATVAEAEHQMVQLALAIARRIVIREVTIDQDLVVTIARIALERLGRRSAATIRLNPEDYAAVSERHSADWAGVRMQVVPDEGVSRGGCKVESDVGFVDGTIEAQFAEIAGELLGDAEAVGVAHGPA